MKKCAPFPIRASLLWSIAYIVQRKKSSVMMFFFYHNSSSSNRRNNGSSSRRYFCLNDFWKEFFDGLSAGNTAIYLQDLLEFSNTTAMPILPICIYYRAENGNRKADTRFKALNTTARLRKVQYPETSRRSLATTKNGLLPTFHGIRIWGHNLANMVYR